MNRYNSRLVSMIIVFALAVGALLTYLRLAGLYDEAKYPRNYSDYVTEYSEKYNVPEYIVYAVIHTESSFIERAVSNQGAVGLMQITADTFNWLISKTEDDYEASKLYDPEINIKYGTLYLSLLYNEFSDWETAYAAYNAGRTRVSQWLNDSSVSSDGKLVNIPIEETASYVKKVVSAAKNYERIYY